MAASKDHREIVQKTITEVETLVRTQTRRRALADPSADWNQIIEIENVKATLERLAADFENEGAPGGADLVRSLIEDWLPVLKRELGARR